ncbi:unnamed protein product, partial [Pylaiella littoralis]
MPTFIRCARSPHPNLSTPVQSTMGSKIDQAWEDMKGPEAAKSRAYASRVKWILNGSKPADTRSARGVPTGVQPRQRPSSNLALYGLEPNALDSQESSVSHFRATCPREPIGAEGPRIVSTETRSAENTSRSLLASWQKNTNGAADGAVSTRRISMQNLTRGLQEVVQQIGESPFSIQNALSTDPRASSGTFLEEVMSLLMEDLAKVVFKGLADPAEACREACIQAVTLFVEHVPDLTPYLAYLYPVLMARGVPMGSLYDPGLEIFVHDSDEHDAYKRGRASERRDHHLPLVQHIAEGSEELRLSLCRMVGRMMVTLMARGTIGVLRPYLDDTILLLVSQCRDPYSTVAVEALSIITKLVLHPYLEQGMKFYAVGISRAILPHLRHRQVHAKVRLAALKALRMTVKVPDRAKVKGAGTSVIVDLVGFREDNVLPVAAFYGRGDTTVNYLAELTTDRSVSVRTETTAMLSDWLTSLPDRYDHQTRLLPYILNAIADDAKVVAAIAIATLSKCGAEYELDHQDEILERRQFGVDGDVRANHTKPLPRPFSGRPRIGARLYVRSNSRRFLLPLLVEMSNWISNTRLQSALLFRTLVVYCEEHLTVETHKLVPHLQRALHLAISAKDKILEDTLLECCELVGRFVVPESYLPHILSRIKEEPEIHATGHRATLLTILWKLMEGSLPNILLAYTPDIIDAVTAQGKDIMGEATSVRHATVKVLFVTAKSMERCGRQVAEEATFARTGRLASTEGPITSALVYLLACRSLTDSPIEVDESLRSLAAASDMSSMEALVAAHAEKIVESICADFPIGPTWTRTCCPQLVLEALLSVCPQVPSTCQTTLPDLLHLCEQIVNKLNNFSDGDQEEVLTTVVGTLLLRAINAWRCGDPSTRLARSPRSAPVVSYLLDLGLQNCWSKTPSLRRYQMEIIVAFMENKTWRHLLSTCPSDTEHILMGIMAPILVLLEHPETQQQQRCEVLSLISQVLQAPRFKFMNPCVKNPDILRREEPGKLECTMAADAFPTVLARLDDRSDDVARKAIQTLGDLLPFVQPEITGREPPHSEVQQGQPDTENITDGNVVPATTFQFEHFVEKCVMRIILMTATDRIDKLDTLLRRAACLDPKSFTSILARISASSHLSKPARQLISDLADHGNFVASLK